MAKVSIEELVKEVGISVESLSQRCSDEHLRSISQFLDWRVTAPHLGLEEAEIQAIDEGEKREEGKRLKTLEKWKALYAFKATHKMLVEILLKVGRADHAEKVCQLLSKSESESEPNTGPGTQGRGHQDVFLTRAIDILKPLQNVKTNAKDEVAQEAVQDFITSSLQAGRSLEYVQQQLLKLHRDEHLIAESMYQVASKLATETHTQLQMETTQLVQAAPSKAEPLFCKDTIYHAGICCLAVNTCDAGNYQGFFKKKDMVPGHSFQEVSVSRSKYDHYLVAKQSNATMYFAFQSQPKLLEWKDFKSFSEGIKSQSEKFPIRFIVELLNEKQRIVLTGFSFGGLLACTVAAQVWDSPYLSSDLLKENLACITFGQPCVTMPLLERVVQTRPELVTTLHVIYSQDDVMPRLMRFLDESCSSTALTGSSADGSRKQLVFDSMKAPLQDPVTSQLLEYMGKIQETAPTPESLSELKSKLVSVAPQLADNRALPLCTTPYLISSECTTGMKCSKMTEEQAHQYSKHLQIAEIDKINVSLFEQHDVLAYNQKKIYLGILENEPKYALPPYQQHSPREASFIRPSAEAVELRHHGSETAVVLEGKNLWFCHQIAVGGCTQTTPPDTLSASSIQFNIPREKSKIATEGGKVKVALHSYFTKVLRHEVPVNERVYDVTTRQEQLARVTPSKLIELAYLSALLEQHPHTSSAPLSHKVEVIRKFLEEVVHVVPLESIMYAIAHGSEKTVMMCFEALKRMFPHGDLPSSTLICDGLNDASARTKMGIPAHISRKTNKESLKQTGAQYAVFKVMKTAEEVVVIAQPRLPGTNLPLPFTQPTTFTEKLSEDLTPTPEIRRAGECLGEWYQRLLPQYDAAIQRGAVICGLNIEQLYPVKPTQNCSSVLSSPIDVLKRGKEELADLAHKAAADSARLTCSSEDHKLGMRSLYNQQMLDKVNSIRSKELATCTSLLGGFMEQEEVDISLVKSQRDQSQTLAVSAQASVGVWGLFSLKYSDIHPILSRCHGNQLVVKVEEYIKGIFNQQSVAEDDPYAAKLQFIAQGMTKTVTCNSQYISYSLECQLIELCTERNIDSSIPVDTLLMKWGKLFKENILSLIARSDRPLIARWLRWALMVHNLREELAKYTAVGIAGLVNSGKSKLVSTLFGIQIPTGTIEAKRTTVPFMYNLEETIEGLDVVDFPGVDDEDDTIPNLADLLLTIAQIIIFVVDYRKIHTQSAKKWLERLQVEKVPVLVCLTFADKLYAEHMTEEGQYPSEEYMKRQLKEQLSVTKKRLGATSAAAPSVRFFSFSQDRDSVLNREEGRQRLRDVGIDTPLDVGEWLVDVFRKDFGQESLADRLPMARHFHTLLAQD